MDDGGGGGGGADRSLNLPGGVGLKLGTPGLTAGPDDENGVGVWGGAGGVGRKEGGSDPATGPVDEKGVIVWEAAKGEEAGLAGKLGRPGFSVPIDYRTIQISRLLFDQNLCSITKPVKKKKKYSNLMYAMLDTEKQRNASQFRAHNTAQINNN